MNRRLLAVLVLGLATTGAMAQFTGPGAGTAPSTVAAVKDARPGSDITLEGNIIERRVWRGRYIEVETLDLV